MTTGIAGFAECLVREHAVAQSAVTGMLVGIGLGRGGACSQYKLKTLLDDTTLCRERLLTYIERLEDVVLDEVGPNALTVLRERLNNEFPIHGEEEKQDD